MNNSVYESPESNLYVEGDSTGSALKGVLYGVLIDIGGTTIFGALFLISYALILIGQGVSEGDVATKIENLDILSIPSLIGMFIGLLFSFLAGFICAKKSINNIYRNTSILSVISAGIGFAAGSGSYSVSENILLTVLTVATIFLGAYYWKNKNS